MRHHTFSDTATSFHTALLMKRTAFLKDDLRNNYVNPLASMGVATDGVVAFTLEYNDSNKAPASFIKEYLDKLLNALDSIDVKYLYVTDSAYFKVLAGKPKAEPHLGYALPCKIKGYEHMTVVLGINYQQLIYNPVLKDKLNNTLTALATAQQGTYQAPGSGIIHSAHYPEGYQAIKEALQSLHQHPELTCDIEGFSLKFNEAGIGTITFCWDVHNGMAFAVDYQTYAEQPDEGYHGWQGVNLQVRSLLRDFFETYQGNLTFHHCTYDIKCIIAALWMKDLLDTEGLLHGLEVMTRNFDDSKIIAYLATNSTAGNQLGLKVLAQEFAGNWAVEEIKDIRRIPLPDLLQYNLVDGLSTHYVKKKYLPVMQADNQEDLYQGLFKDSLKLIIQMELTGMPMSRKRIQEVKQELETIQDNHLNVISNSPIVKMLNLILGQTAWEDDFESRKAKAKNPQNIKPKELSAFDGVTFNPNSGPQLQRLLYEYIGLPVLDYTDSKAPATGAETIEKLLNHTQDAGVKALLEAIVGYGKANKILSTFIPAFEGAINKDGSDTVWLHGCFNLGGTVSGRLSSSDPNLTNLPAGSEYGKLIKSCFIAAKGWLFVGADYNALEDRVNTLLTKDPNKLKVFTQGYDSHCLRASYFFPEKLPGITDSVASVNSIKKLFPEIRQLAKSPAFALQYAGTWRTLVNTLGFDETTAKNIEKGYRELYKVSEDWVKEKIATAAKQGYGELAFGLRVRTPLLAQVVWGSPDVPTAAQAEARTLGNAISGQSYCMLNNRSANSLMQQVWESDYRLDILPIAQIHDAQYYLVRDTLEHVEWLNTNLPMHMAWQELPEIQHHEVTLGGELDIFWPSWAKATTLPVNATKEEIFQLCQETKKKLLKTT